MTQLLIALAVMSVSGPGGDSSPHSSAELISEVSAVAPGGSFWVAYQIKLDPHWHTYWKNPGDSGSATDIRWTMNGTKIAPNLEFPVPSSLVADGMTIYGYEGQPMFLARLTAPRTAKVGQTLKLTAAGSWLVCEAACMPASETVVLSLPVAKMRRASASKAIIDGALAALPQPAAGWKFVAGWTSTGIALTVTPPPGVDASRGTFYCEDSQIVDHSGRQVWSGSTLTIPKSPYANGKATRLRGILVAPADQPWKGAPRAVIVDVPFASTKRI